MAQIWPRVARKDGSDVRFLLILLGALFWIQAMGKWALCKGYVATVYMRDGWDGNDSSQRLLRDGRLDWTSDRWLMYTAYTTARRRRTKKWSVNKENGWYEHTEVFVALNVKKDGWMPVHNTPGGVCGLRLFKTM